MLSKLFGKTKSKTIEILAPLSGEVLALTAVPDEAFAGKHMGDGIAIEPSEGKIVAPFDGTVAHLIHTNHAIIVEHNSGLQLLIHIGINTVALNGNGFRAHVSSGDSFQAGDILIEFDRAVIEAAGCPSITPIVIANEDEVKQLEHIVSSGSVTAGAEAVLRAEMNE
ncbi:PTS glucose transporter subunit IIA [Paenibacillus alkaliterrae]|uniref:PTS sugar transporter subunit IIA n=1 Tax=Paenibacillus alkaliterrae TaxID=320909 RepID=UPI001F297134|nr:PTS glucose transporter subunit IIA [Paenibacillus alkaliterrae]MCF2938498.1 PTS glucose transporter subunit IIA [Paenibacillus alkaliterrae]